MSGWRPVSPSPRGSGHSGLVLVFALLFFCLLVLARVRRLLTADEGADSGGAEGALDLGESGGLLAHGGAAGNSTAAGASASPVAKSRGLLGSNIGGVRPSGGMVLLDVLTDEEQQQQRSEERERPPLRAAAAFAAAATAAPSASPPQRGMSLKGGAAARTARGGIKKAKIGLGAKPLDESD